MLSFVEQHDEEYTHLDKAAMRLLSELIDLELPEKAESDEEVEEGMCKALEEIRAMGVEEGEAIGEARGEARGKAKSIIEFAKELGWSTEQTLQRLQEKLDIFPEEAKEYLHQYQ